MIKRFIAFFFSGILVTALLGVWIVAHAQAPLEEDFAPKPIPIAFCAETDGTTYRPEDVEQSDSPNQRVQIGEDNREPVLTQFFPWSAIGRIDWVLNGEEVHQCTGTLIGRDLILTNSHCVAVYNENKLYSINSIVFKPNVIEGSFVFRDKANVISRIFGWQLGILADADWALLKIDKPLGDKYGYLGWRNLDFSDENILSLLQGQIRLAGYSGDFPSESQRKDWNLQGKDGDTAGVHLGCSIEGVSENLPYTLPENRSLPSGLLLHNCDTMGGASGAAVLAKFNDGNYYIVGLHRGFYPLDPESFPDEVQETCIRRTSNGDEEIDSCLNAAVQVSRWSSQALELRSESQQEQ